MVTKNKEIDLLYGETIVAFIAKTDLDPFEISYVAPLNYEDQAPILLNIKEQTSSKILNYRIVDDKNPPNKLIKFSVGSLKKNEEIIINFEYWVLVKNNQYLDLPKFIKIPTKKDLTDDLQKWLQPTKAVQSDNIFIKIKANIKRRLSNNSVKLARRIMIPLSYNRVLFTLIRLFFEKIKFPHYIISRDCYWTKLMDSTSALIFGGLCAAQSNLGTALFRANGVPARNLISTSMFYDFKKWVDAQHFLVECYFDNYGWVRCMSGKFPYETKDCIILRINYPSDENEAGNGLSYYGGCEPWFWYPNKYLSLTFSKKIFHNRGIKGVAAPYFCGGIKKEIEINEEIANNTLLLTQKIWESYIKYLGVKFDKEKNHQYFETALNYQKSSIKKLLNSNVEEYMEDLNRACESYKKIDFS